jgi:histidinol dehydrogenase
MKKFEYPSRDTWQALIERPALDQAPLRLSVRRILDDIKSRGDEAVRYYTEQFDGVSINGQAWSQAQRAAAAETLSPELKTAIRTAAQNIERFHQSQLQPIVKVETMPGVLCWRKSIGMERVGLYIPGGTAPLFSTILMLGIPARLAGCKELILCTPPQADGTIHPAILYAAAMAGIDLIFPVGGVQAIGAMAFGTANIPKVDKIFGPGNQYVTCAKQLVQEEGVAIDMPAGPSEVCVLADHTAIPAFVAADLLSQAEHGRDSQVLLVTVDGAPVDAILQALETQLSQLPRKELAAAALQNSRCIHLSDLQAGIDLVNLYAAEHLILSIDRAAAWAEHIQHAGSVFIGHFSPESVGDYASGTNHTLPTNGYARAYSGVSVDSFVRKVTFQELDPNGLQTIGPTVIAMAEAEGLEAHAAAVRVRQAFLNQEKN